VLGCLVTDVATDRGTVTHPHILLSPINVHELWYSWL